MKSDEDKALRTNIVEEQFDNQETIDRQTVLELFKNQANNKAEIAHQKKLDREREVFELYNGTKTSIFNEREKIRRITEDIPRDHGPRFKLFFLALGKLAKWTDEEIKAYHKPHLGPKTINEIIYNRFPKEVMLHIHTKNPYIKWCTRLHKHYLFLNDEGILLLEKFIDDAVTVMMESTTVYEFRIKHAERFGSGFQLDLFEEYLGKITN